MKFILLILTLLFYLSCTSFNEKSYPRYSSFEAERTLCAKALTLDTILFRYPFRVAVEERLAIVLDLHNADHFLHAFSFPEWEHIASFGRRGQAPDEMLSAETIRLCSPDSIWTLDANKMEITRWSVNTTTRAATKEETISLDKQLIRTLDFCLTDSGFVVPDYTGHSRYSRIDANGNFKEAYAFIPTEETYTKIAMPALAQAWRSFIDYNPNNNRLVMTTQLGEVLEICNLNNGTKKIRYGPNGEPSFQIQAGKGVPNGIMGFSDVKITDNYIYTVFHGRTFKEIMQSQAKGVNLEDGGHYLYVFDLDGNPITKYTLDRAVYGIHVNETSGIITATDVNSDNPIIHYDIGTHNHTAYAHKTPDTIGK